MYWSVNLPVQVHESTVRRVCVYCLLLPLRSEPRCFAFLFRVAIALHPRLAPCLLRECIGSIRGYVNIASELANLNPANVDYIACITVFVDRRQMVNCEYYPCNGLCVRVYVCACVLARRFDCIRVACQCAVYMRIVYE